MLTLSVDGLQDTLKLLEDFPKTIANKTFKKAGEAGIAIIGEAIQVRVPRDTGVLAASMFTSVKVRSGGVVGGAYSVDAEVGFAGIEGEIAKWVEYGHQIVAHGKPAGVAQPHPFMRPAFDASADAAIEAFAEVIEAELK